MGECNIEHAIIYFDIVSNWSSLFNCSLNNLKEECARNSFFQLLYHLPPFRLHVLDESYRGRVTNALRNIFNLMQTSDKSFYALLSQFLKPPSHTLERFNDSFTPKQGMSNIIVSQTVLWLKCVVAYCGGGQTVLMANIGHMCDVEILCS